MNDFQNQFFKSISSPLPILGALESIPGAMFMIKNLDSCYIYMSQALRMAIHVPAGEEVVGKTDFDLFPKIIAEQFRQNDLLVFQNGTPLVNEIHYTGFFNHAPKWSFSSKYPLFDDDHKIIGLVTINTPYGSLLGESAELNRLLPAIEHVSTHYQEPIPIALLAELSGCSETHFMRTFKKRMKMTAYAFVEQVRMFHAIDAIRHRGTTISTIAKECGFYDHSAFVKRFRKFTGMTPLHYRKEFQAKVDQEGVQVLPRPLG